MKHVPKLSNEYSDHCPLDLSLKFLKIKQLNVAQLGRLQLFSNERIPEGFNWSCTLRTVSMLKLLADKKQGLLKLGFKLLAIVKDDSLQIEEKNAKIEKESSYMLGDLHALGFEVKSFRMVSNKLFNPGVSPNLLWQNPDNYVKGPAFVLEDTDSFTKRMKDGFDVMFSEHADIVTSQEVEFGESDGINFSDIHDSLMKSHDSYEFIVPMVINQATITVTYFNKNVFRNISQDNLERLDDLKKKFKCFGESDLKTVVVALEHIETKDIFIIINVHADYSRSNTEEPWKLLRELFEQVPNLIVSGDFNLTLKNEHYFRNPFKNFKGSYTILRTPEPIDIGNPTFDLIISH